MSRCRVIKYRVEGPQVVADKFGVGIKSNPTFMEREPPDRDTWKCSELSKSGRRRMYAKLFKFFIHINRTV